MGSHNLCIERSGEQPLFTTQRTRSLDDRSWFEQLSTRRLEQYIHIHNVKELSAYSPALRSRSEPWPLSLFSFKANGNQSSKVMVEAPHDKLRPSANSNRIRDRDRTRPPGIGRVIRLPSASGVVYPAGASLSSSGAPRSAGLFTSVSEVLGCETGPPSQRNLVRVRSTQMHFSSS